MKKEKKEEKGGKNKQNISDMSNHSRRLYGEPPKTDVHKRKQTNAFQVYFQTKSAQANKNIKQK